MFVVVVAVEEIGMHGQDALQVEGATIQDLFDRYGGALGAVDYGKAVDLAYCASTASSSSGVTRSVLFSTITSAKAI